MIKREDSRAMSTIVATLLVIMLTMVAIGIVWVVIKNVIVNQSELMDIKKEFFAENLEISSLKIEGGLVSLSLKRIGGEVNTQTSTHITETTINLEVDIMSVVDLSGSMVSCNGVSQYTCCRNVLGSNTYEDGNCYGVNTNRNLSCISSPCNGVWVDKLTPTKEANKQLLNIISEVEGSKIGLVSYSTNVISGASLDLTDNITKLNNTINSWQATGGTCICCGINNASQRLELQSSNDKHKKMIVMSDGQANYECTPYRSSVTSGPIDAIQSSCNAYNDEDLENLTIYSIGFGTEVNHTTLKAIADCGGGENFSALDVSDLVDVYTQVAQEIITSSIVSNRFNYLYIIFYNETDTYREKILDIPDNLEVRNYDINLDGKLSGEIVKIEVFPVIVLKSGKEEIGPLFDSWTKQG